MVRSDLEIEVYVIIMLTNYNQRASSVIVHVTYVHILYAHARESIAKKRPKQRTTNLLQLKLRTTKKVGSWTLSIDYACSKRAELATLVRWLREIIVSKRIKAPIYLCSFFNRY